MTSFFETVGGWPTSRCLAGHSTVKSMVEDLRLELMSDRPRAIAKANCIAVAFVIAWELVVGDPTEIFYLRLLAWVKLIRIWAALRSSDLLGIAPKDMVMKEGSLKGCITESKVTGKGKKVGTIFFHGAKGAWIKNEDWFQQGWALFKDSETERSCLLSLPVKDLTAQSCREPSYTQSAAASRKLLASTRFLGDGIELEDNEAQKRMMLATGAQHFWSEHSDRATLPSWAASMGFPNDQCDKLGRWKASESQEYVRTAKTIVTGIQTAVAGRIRSAGQADVTGEDDLLENLEDFLRIRGAKESLIREQHRKPTFHRTQTAPESQHCAAPTQLDIDNVVALAVAVEDELGQEEAQLSHWALLVSLSSQGRPQTLHKVGACWRRPGIDYKRFAALGEDEAQAPYTGYHKVCSDCFPKGDDEQNVSSSGSSSNSSSSDSDS
ncbi:unnamed protein product [Polarella glacialis]|uniref:Uncharacterized protein n=1 Tax=Polarella glacialis TaxID=89957 RepID=A0A813J8Z1_POLGL|nr:unnamed protein product [Polarella glacialis]